MEYVYATLLLHEVKEEITQDKIQAILESVGIVVDPNHLTVLIDALDGVDIATAVKRISPTPTVPHPPVVEQTVVEEKPVEEDVGVGLDKLFG